jgi:hypothetical protein
MLILLQCRVLAEGEAREKKNIISGFSTSPFILLVKCAAIQIQSRGRKMVE